MRRDVMLTSLPRLLEQGYNLLSRLVAQGQPTRDELALEFTKVLLPTAPSPQDAVSRGYAAADAFLAQREAAGAELL